MHHSFSFQVGDYCFRVSSVEEQYETARNMCISEGADLAYILDSEMQQGLKDLILAKKTEFPHFFNAKYFWVGGDVSLCLLYTSPSPRDRQKSRMPSSA